MKTLKTEIDRGNQKVAEGEAEHTKLLSELHHWKAELLDVQRSEKALKVDLEQAQKKVCCTSSVIAWNCLLS